MSADLDNGGSQPPPDVRTKTGNVRTVRGELLVDAEPSHQRLRPIDDPPCGISRPFDETTDVAAAELVAAMGEGGHRRGSSRSRSGAGSVARSSVQPASALTLMMESLRGDDVTHGKAPRHPRGTRTQSQIVTRLPPGVLPSAIDDI